MQDMYVFLKKTKKQFSFRFFSKEAGLSSPNFLKLVMDGQRNLTQSSIIKFSKAFKHTQQEIDFFENLVLFNQAQTSEEKNKFYLKLTKSRRYREIKKLEKEQVQFYSHWVHSALREMVALSNFKEDVTWLSERLEVSEKEVKDSLDLLLKLNLIQRNKEGKLIQSDGLISAGPEIQKMSLINFHQEMLNKTKASLERVPSDQRDISAVTLGVSQDMLPALKECVAQFHQDMLAIISNSKCSLDQVYQLNIQLFPLSHKEKK